MMNIELGADWQKALAKYMVQEPFQKLIKKVSSTYTDKVRTVYPIQENLFNAFNKTPLNKVHVVILGQDPYHNPGQAHGLCFSVPEGVKIPPSLRNIFKEVGSDVYRDDNLTNDGMCTDLTRWAEQGVFLLNSILTVLESQPASHGKLGWEDFTDHVIKTISNKQEHVVFMLWGAYAQSKTHLINSGKHLILTAPHPSPLSAYRGFFGCKHFSKCNEYLQRNGKKIITW